MRETDEFEAWERRKGESAQAYEAFTIYLNIGPDRSIRAVTQKLLKSYTLISRWSRTNGWQERVAAYDNHIQHIKDRENFERAERLAKNQVDMSIALANISLKKIQSMDVDEMSPRDAKELLKLALSVQDKHAIDPYLQPQALPSYQGHRYKVEGQVEHPNTGPDLSNLTDEDLRALASMKEDDES